MSTVIDVVAIFTPSPGKHERLRELLTELAKNVEANEPDVVRYQLFEQVNSEGVNTFVVQECYANQAAFDAHFKTPYFQVLGKAIPEENLVAVPLDIKTIKPIAGFVSR